VEPATPTNPPKEDKGVGLLARHSASPPSPSVSPMTRIPRRRPSSPILPVKTTRAWACLATPRPATPSPSVFPMNTTTPWSLPLPPIHPKKTRVWPAWRHLCQPHHRHQHPR
jgi:hypothetical protein